MRQHRPRIISPEDLRALRKSTGLPMTQAARAMGIGYRTLTAYENGEVNAPKTVITLLQVLAARRQALIAGKRKDILDFIDANIRVSL